MVFHDRPLSGPQRGALRTSRTGYVRVTYGVAYGAWYGLRTVLGPYVARRTVRRTDPNFFKIKTPKPGSNPQSPLETRRREAALRTTEGKGGGHRGPRRLLTAPLPSQCPEAGIKAENWWNQKGSEATKIKAAWVLDKKKRSASVSSAEEPTAKRHMATAAAPAAGVGGACARC